MRKLIDTFTTLPGALHLVGCIAVLAALAWAGPALALSPEGVTSALIINAANLGDMFKGFQTRFNEGFWEADPKWSNVATLVPSTTASERYGWLGQFPQLREWLGDRQVANLEAHDYTLKNRKFESTVAVPKDAIEDDQYGVYSPLFSEMGFAAATHPDELVFDLLANGFSQLAYDGQYFFDSDHPVGDSTVSNMQSGSSNPWFLLDTRRMLKPLIFQRRREYSLRSMTQADDEQVFMRDEYRYGVDARVNAGYAFWQMAFGSQADLTAANFEAAMQAMMAFQSDEGRPLGVTPSLLVVGPSNRAAAKEVVEAERDSNGATNINRNAVNILVTPYLQ